MNFTTAFLLNTFPIKPFPYLPKQTTCTEKLFEPFFRSLNPAYSSSDFYLDPFPLQYPRCYLQQAVIIVVTGTVTLPFRVFARRNHGTRIPGGPRAVLGHGLTKLRGIPRESTSLAGFALKVLRKPVCARFWRFSLQMEDNGRPITAGGSFDERSEEVPITAGFDRSGLPRNRPISNVI